MTVFQKFTFHYVSIKSQSVRYNPHTACIFTFHYVSIKSLSALGCFHTQVDLHSTMYLLNLRQTRRRDWKGRIYIPLCIY